MRSNSPIHVSLFRKKEERFSFTFRRISQLHNNPTSQTLLRSTRYTKFVMMHDYTHKQSHLPIYFYAKFAWVFLKPMFKLWLTFFRNVWLGLHGSVDGNFSWTQTIHETGCLHHWTLEIWGNCTRCVWSTSARGELVIHRNSRLIIL